MRQVLPIRFHRICLRCRRPTPRAGGDPRKQHQDPPSSAQRRAQTFEVPQPRRTLLCRWQIKGETSLGIIELQSHAVSVHEYLPPCRVGGARAWNDELTISIKVHCRRRKIRCLSAADDPQNRCSNCIRLKKECNFYPVDQQPTQELRARAGSKVELKTGSNSASSSSSPGLTVGTSADQIENFNHFPIVPVGGHPFSGAIMTSTGVAMSPPGSAGKSASICWCPRTGTDSPSSALYNSL